MQRLRDAVQFPGNLHERLQRAGRAHGVEARRDSEPGIGKVVAEFDLFEGGHALGAKLGFLQAWVADEQPRIVVGKPPRRRSIRRWKGR